MYTGFVIPQLRASQVWYVFIGHEYIIFYYISKALDRVWHRGLLFKLKQNGFNGRLLDWIEKYLSNRTQNVFIGSSVSNYKFNTAGVPQDSALGLFDIIDNLLSIARLFDDDTSLAFTTSNLLDLEGILNHNLRIISFWAKQWLADFNPNKTEAILFTLEQNVTPPLLLFDHTLTGKLFGTS